jgi:glycine cleavage system H protein
MGKYAARLPGDRYYARNHMWCLPQDDFFRFGFTAYAIRLMQDVYFLEWHLSVGDTLERTQQIGHIETSKAVSDLFAPMPGRITTFNQELLADPSGINVDGYGAGWLFDMAGPKDSELMSVDQYYQFLDANWEKTQRHIKGKINTED